MMHTKMFSFKFFLENKIGFEHNPKIGWWKDSEEHMTLYHGTHDKNVPDILKNGLKNKDKTTGMISLTHDPHTAHGYAAMSGGEANFRSAGARATHTPHEDRSVIKFKVPKKWVDKHIDKNLRGNIGTAEGNLKDKTKYDMHAASGKADHEYYAMSEIRVSKEVPAKFIVGHMKKKEK